MKKAKIKSIDNRTGEYLPRPKEKVEKYSKDLSACNEQAEQIKLFNKLLKLNISEVTAENLVKNNDQGLIKKWIEAINYSNGSVLAIKRII